MRPKIYQVLLIYMPFQFQYGTIMSYRATDNDWFALVISIPVWYDYEKIKDYRLLSLLEFQFQYGTIMRRSGWSRAAKLMHFNSSMVRLWGKDANGKEWSITNFNSSMVRLWVQRCILRYFHRVISIPVWYDYEPCRFLRYFSRSQFQFQYGTIMSQERFQSSWSYTISIPVWYDYEALENIKMLEKALFQFQYGTIMSIPT